MRVHTNTQKHNGVIFKVFINLWFVYKIVNTLFNIHTHIHTNTFTVPTD